MFVQTRKRSKVEDGAVSTRDCVYKSSRTCGPFTNMTSDSLSQYEKTEPQVDLE